MKTVTSVLKETMSSKPVKVWCPSCWVDRVITSNGKCLTCGTKLVRPKHWDTTIRKLELIWKNRSGYIAVEIRNRIYMVPFPYMDEFENLDRTDHEKTAAFIETIKEKCQSYSV